MVRATLTELGVARQLQPNLPKRHGYLVITQLPRMMVPAPSRSAGWRIALAESPLSSSMVCTLAHAPPTSTRAGLIEQTIAGRLAEPAWDVVIVPQHAPGDNTRIASGFQRPCQSAAAAAPH
jgi:hypothetical protein